ncbi:MAG: MoaD/ThiS family protein [Actinobacteria bacterium]|nr:MoaD/ThiS family protein [Actinomycetota bacterium]
MRVRLRNPERVVDVPGPTTVAAVLERLEIPAHTVLVIRSGELVPAVTALDDDDEVEVRPVISGGASDTPRCVVCRAAAVIEEPRHRSAWCRAHFVDHVHAQIRKAIDRYRMISYDLRTHLP